MYLCLARIVAVDMQMQHALVPTIACTSDAIDRPFQQLTLIVHQPECLS